MTRDIKILLAIVAGAALAGWVVVRLGAPTPENSAPGVPVASAPVAEEPVEEPVIEAAEDRASPLDPKGPAEDDEADTDAILRDLDILVRAVRKDKYAPEVAFPDSTKILEFPSMIHYVRAVEFWQSAFPSEEGDR